MNRNEHPTVCVRCGLNLRRGAGVLNTLFNWYEHERCHRVYAGSPVHYLFNPDPRSPVEIYEHILHGQHTLFNVTGIQEALRGI